jgi:hypothetical protein
MKKGSEWHPHTLRGRMDTPESEAHELVRPALGPVLVRDNLKSGDNGGLSEKLKLINIRA